MDIGQLAVICQPNTKVSTIVGWNEHRLRVRVAAPAQEGQANDELIRIIAAVCHIAPSLITITHGHGNKIKLLTMPLAAIATLRATMPKND